MSLWFTSLRGHGARTQGWPFLERVRQMQLFYPPARAHWVICIPTNTVAVNEPPCNCHKPRSLRPSSGKFRSFFHFRKVLQVNLFPSCVWIFYGLSGFAGFARHSHGSLLNCSTWFRFWNLYQTTLLLFEMKDITFQLLEETHFDLIFPIFSYLWSL